MIAPVLSQDDRLSRIVRTLRAASLTVLRNPVKATLVSGVFVGSFVGLKYAHETGCRLSQHPHRSLFRPSRDYIRRYLGNALAGITIHSNDTSHMVEGLWNNQLVPVNVTLGRGINVYSDAVDALLSLELFNLPGAYLYKTGLGKASALVLLSKEGSYWTLTPLQVLSYRRELPLQSVDTNSTSGSYSSVCMRTLNTYQGEAFLAMRIVQQDVSNCTMNRPNVFLQASIVRGNNVTGKTPEMLERVAKVVAAHTHGVFQSSTMRRRIRSHTNVNLSRR